MYKPSLQSFPSQPRAHAHENSTLLTFVQTPLFWHGFGEHGSASRTADSHFFVNSEFYFEKTAAMDIKINSKTLKKTLLRASS